LQSRQSTKSRRQDPLGLLAVTPPFSLRRCKGSGAGAVPVGQLVTYQRCQILGDFARGGGAGSGGDGGELLTEEAKTWCMGKVASDHQVSNKMIFQVPTKNSFTGERGPSMHPVLYSSLGHVDEL